MPSIKKMLQLYDLDLIGRISSFWGVDSADLDFSAAIESLSQVMRDALLAKEVIDSLPPSAKEAWMLLTANPKKMTWSQFIRKFGEVREFGPARREREEPELHPVSIAEQLWYRGLIGRAFMNLPPELREFVFIPDELIIKPDLETKGKLTPDIESVSKSSIKREINADSRLIDHMTDWLAARRMNRKLPDIAWRTWHQNESFLTGIASECGLIDKNGKPSTNSLALFFQQDSGETLTSWLAAWKRCSSINELKSLPGLIFEGEVPNDPVRTRQFLMEMLDNLEPDTWYGLTSFVNAIKTGSPDFQRPSGDYDSWFIRKAETKNFLRGFEHWDEVDGALIKYLLCGPLHWLGLLDLGLTDDNSKIFAFRKSSLFNAITHGKKSASQANKEVLIKISTELVFTIPLFASRMLRYQIARFCEVRTVTAEETSYEITPFSLRSAQESGLKPSQLIQLLEKQLKTPLPKSLLLSIGHWEKVGLAVKIETGVLMRTQTAEIMQAIQRNPRTAKFIIELISPTAAVINPGGTKVIKEMLLEEGWLTELDLQG